MKHFVSLILVASLIISTSQPARAQDLERAVGALIGGIIGGAIQRDQRQRQAQPQRQRQAQQTRPAISHISEAQRQQTREVQTALNHFDFSAGGVDGLMGRNTRNAIRSYQRAMGFTVSGKLDDFQRGFLIASYHRARHSGSIAPYDRILAQEGPQALLLAFRDEQRGISLNEQTLGDASSPSSGSFRSNDLSTGEPQITYDQLRTILSDDADDWVSGDRDAQRDALKLDLQRDLRTLDLYGGAIDGILGRGTSQGVRQFSQMAGLPDEISDRLLSTLLAAATIRKDRGGTAQAAVAAAPVILHGAADFMAAQAADASGDHAKALPLYRSALGHARNVLGDDSALTVNAMHFTAQSLERSGQYDKAGRLYVKAHESLRQIHGDTHSDTLEAADSLGNLRMLQGRHDEARDLFRQTLDRRSRSMGATHPDVLRSRYNLARVSLFSGDVEAGERELTRIYNTTREALGPAAPLLAAMQHDLVTSRLNLDRSGDAEALLRDAVAEQRRALGPRHARTLASEAALGETLVMQGKNEAGEALLEKTLEGHKATLGATAPATQAVEEMISMISPEGKGEARPGDDTAEASQAIPGEIRRSDDPQISSAGPEITSGGGAVEPAQSDTTSDAISGEGTRGYSQSAQVTPEPAAVHYGSEEYPTIRREFRGFGNQGIDFTMTISAQRTDGGAHVRLESVAGRHVPGAGFNALETEDSFEMGLHVVTREVCEGCTPDFVRQSEHGMRLRDGVIKPHSLPIEVFVPDTALETSDMVGVAIYGNNRLFLAPDSEFAVTELDATSQSDAEIASDAAHNSTAPAEELDASAGLPLFGAHAIIDFDDANHCLRHFDWPEFRECLESAGASEAEISAARELSSGDANSFLASYWPTEGPVDVAEILVPAASAIWRHGFVRDGRKFTLAGVERMDVQDAASHQLQRRYPDAISISPAQVISHRYLDDGGQRFILSALINDGCRACDVIAIALGYVDFQNGERIDEGTIGWAQQRGDYPTDQDEVRRRLYGGDVLEVQIQLNRLGYIAGSMDGAFGPGTKRALRAFRREHCLGDSDEWTQATADKLLDLYSTQGPVLAEGECGPRTSRSHDTARGTDDGQSAPQEVQARFADICSRSEYENAPMSCPFALHDTCAGSGCSPWGPEWAHESARLYDSPGGNLIDNIEKGQWLWIDVTNSYATPCRAEVMRTWSDKLNPGDRVWRLLDKEGGFSIVWSTTGLDEAMTGGTSCPYRAESWARAILEDGTTGWLLTHETDFPAEGSDQGKNPRVGYLSKYMYKPEKPESLPAWLAELTERRRSDTAGALAQSPNLRDERRQAEARWRANWESQLASDEPWPNVANLLRYDRPRAIARLAGGQRIELEAQSVEFRRGNGLVKGLQLWTDVYNGLPDPDAASGLAGLEKAINTFRLYDGYIINCRIDNDQLGEIKEGETYVFHSKLLDFSDPDVLFDCKIASNDPATLDAAGTAQSTEPITEDDEDDLNVGNWHEPQGPDYIIEFGDERNGIVFRQNGSVFFKGSEILSAWEAGNAGHFQLQVYHAPLGEAFIILFSHRDFGAARVAGISGEDLIIQHDLNVKYGPTGNLSWSPDGKFFAITQTHEEFSQPLAISEIESGRRIVYLPDWLGSDEVIVNSSLDSLRTDAYGTLSWQMDVAKIVDGLPGKPERRRAAVALSELFDIQSKDQIEHQVDRSEDTADQASKLTEGALNSEYAKPLKTMRLTYGFFNSDYRAAEGVQHLGADYGAPVGTTVYAPVTGIVTLNHSGPGVHADEKWLVIRSADGGEHHVLGHTKSGLELGSRVEAGDIVGQIAPASGGAHFHWGINRLDIWEALDTEKGWGWGRGPAGANREVAEVRGWIDPNDFRGSVRDLPPGEFTAEPQIHDHPVRPDIDEIGTPPVMTGLIEQQLRHGEPALRFENEFPELTTSILKRFGEDLGWRVISELMDELIETNSKSLFGLVWTGASLRDAIVKLDPDIMVPSVIAGAIAKGTAGRALRVYAETASVDVNVEAVVDNAAAAFPFIKTAALGTGGGISVGLAPAALAAKYSYMSARRPVLEDEAFSAISQELRTADSMRQTAGLLDNVGRHSDADEWRDLADDLIEEVAIETEAIFQRGAGEAVAEIFRGMDNVIQLMRADEVDAARELFWELHEFAEDNAPGFWSVSTQEFYQRYFMVGSQRRGGSIRAFEHLEELMHDILDD